MLPIRNQNGLCAKQIHPILSIKFNSPMHQSQLHIQNECQTCSRKQQRECRKNPFIQQPRGDIKKVKRTIIIPKPVAVKGEIINPSGKWQVGFRTVPKEFPKTGNTIEKFSFPRIR